MTTSAFQDGMSSVVGALKSEIQAAGTRQTRSSSGLSAIAEEKFQRNPAVDLAGSSRVGAWRPE